MAHNSRNSRPTSRKSKNVDKYAINIKQIAKFVAGLGDRVTSTDIEEGMLREVVETPSFSACLDRFIRYYYTDSALYSPSDSSTLVSTLRRVFYSIVLQGQARRSAPVL
jgi:hypothetical protein